MIQTPPVRFMRGGVVAPAPTRSHESDLSEALVLYFSRTGATELVARHIAAQLGAELRNLDPDAAPRRPDPSFGARLRAGLRDLRRGRGDELLDRVRNLDFAGRRLLLIGAPIWLRSPAPPLQALLDGADLTGSAVVLFVTHAGRFDERAIAACGELVRRRGGRYLGYLALQGGDGQRERERMLAQLDAQLGAQLASWRQQAKLERTTRRDAPSPSSSLRVALQPRGGRAPLFIVTSGHGDVLALSGLAQRLDPAQPVYALQPPIDVEPELAASVEPALHRIRLARDYAEAATELLDDEQPRCVLAGYSAGCFMAAATAQRLQALGVRVEQLILLEPPPVLWNLDLQVFTALERLVRRYYPRPDRRLPRALHVYHAYFTDAGFAHTIHAATDFRPRRCADEVTLVLADDAWMRFTRRRRSWREAGRAQPRPGQRRVPGDHFSLLRRPHVDLLGHTLRELLARTQP